MYKGKRIAVVVPIHNEAEHLVAAIHRIPDYVDLIVAVDDGSTDLTWHFLSGVNRENVIRLQHAENRGVGAATKTGYSYLVQTDVDFVAVMDGDGQMDGRDLYRLLDRAIQGADYVKGNRFLHTASIGCMPLSRYLGNRTFSWLTLRAIGSGSSLDAQCGYTVIRRSALKRIVLDELYDRYGFPNDMLFAAHRAGLVVDSVAVRTIYADEVSGINPLTAVPTILFLIGRSYVQKRFGPPSPRLLVIPESQNGGLE